MWGGVDMLLQECFGVCRNLGVIALSIYAIRKDQAPIEPHGLLGFLAPYPDNFLFHFSMCSVRKKGSGYLYLTDLR